MSSSIQTSFLESNQVLKEIRRLFRSSESVDIAVAYLKDSGYQEIKQDINSFLHRHKTLRLLVGLADYCITDAEPLEDLLRIQEKANIGKKMRLKYYSNTEFHPKLIIFRETGRVCVIVGSSNFTAGGLGGNIEANVLISGMQGDAEIQKVIAFFERIWRKGARKITSQILADYKTTKTRSPIWNSNRVRQSHIPRTTVYVGARSVLEPSTAYILGLLLSRGEVSSSSVTIRIPCRNRSIIEGHKQFARRTLRQILESTLGERVTLNIQHNPSIQALEITMERNKIRNILKQLRIPANVNFGFNGFIPKKILQANEHILKSFLQGYGDSCATVGTYVSGKARVTLNLDIRNHSVISDLVAIFLSCGIPLSDVDLPVGGGVFNSLARKLTNKGVNVTRGTHTPQIRIWGDVYSETIGFRNGYLAKKLALLL
jgi:HKD family nuclease